MRRGIALVTSLPGWSLAAAAAAVVSAQEAPRTVVITVGPRSVSVEGATAYRRGRRGSRSARPAGSRSRASSSRCKPGRTLAELRRALPRAQRGPAPLKPIITLRGRLGPRPPGRPYVTTIDLRPGTTYVAANIPERVRDTRFAQFTVDVHADHRDPPDAGRHRRRLRLRLRHARRRCRGAAWSASRTAASACTSRSPSRCAAAPAGPR